jgi:hypothetical protein
MTTPPPNPLFDCGTTPGHPMKSSQQSAMTRKPLRLMAHNASALPLVEPEEEYVLRRRVFEEPYKDLFERRVMVAIDENGVKIGGGYFINPETRAQLNDRLWMMLDGEAGAELEHPEGEYLFRRTVFEEPYTDVTGRGMLVAINSSGVKTEEGYFRTIAEREALRERLLRSIAACPMPDGRLELMP